MASGYSKQVPVDPFARARFETGTYLTAASLSLEQQYRLQRLRRHNRHLHGWGVVCGLLVVPAATGARPWAVGVCPGFGIGPYGDEIEVHERTQVDIAEFLWSRPAAPVGTAVPVWRAYVAVRYVEREDALQAVPRRACGCNEPEYVATRVIDGYEAAVIWTPPLPPLPLDICTPPGPSCPECPASPWVVLARVVLPQGASEPITAAMIDNGIRNRI
jgi:hypothetical protein